MKPVEFKVEIRDKVGIAIPQIFANLLGVNEGDSVYINLEDIHKETNIPKQESTSPAEKVAVDHSASIYNAALNADKRKFEYSMATNPIYKITYERLMEFTKDNSAYPREPQKSMRAFYTPRGGLCWLEYRAPGPRPFIVHLAKGEYNEVDTLGKITYSSENTKTWGDYPIFQVSQESDIAYLIKLVKFAIDNKF